MKKDPELGQSLHSSDCFVKMQYVFFFFLNQASKIFLHKFSKGEKKTPLCHTFEEEISTSVRY